MPEKPSRLRRWLVWQRVPIARVPIHQLRRETALLLGYCIFFILLSYATGLLIARFPMPLLGASSFTQDAWYVFLFKLTALLAVPLAVFHKMGYRPRALLLDWTPTIRSLFVVVLAFMAGFCVNLQHFLRVRAAAAVTPGPELALRLSLSLLVPLLTAGLPEEIVFRGLLHSRLEALWGRAAALVTTAVLFAAWHLPTRYLLAHGVEGEAGNLRSVLAGTGLPVFIVGLVFGWLWDRYRRLVPLVALHWGIDVLPTVASFLRLPF